MASRSGRHNTRSDDGNLLDVGLDDTFGSIGATRQRFRGTRFRRLSSSNAERVGKDVRAVVSVQDAALHHS
jgi:hypothetical protein